MDFVDTQKEYKDYRNPKFQSFINRMCEFCAALTLIVAFAAIHLTLGFFYAFGFIFLYMLLSGMRRQMVYFFSNKNLGADWKDTLIRDIARAARYTFAVVGGDLVLVTLFNLFHKS